MTVVVVGAGVIGIATAYYLAGSGASVVVIDRQPGAGLETSYANGGQISANHAIPWAAPSTPLKALKWLGRADAPLLFHLRWDPPLFAWLLRFLGNCTHARLRRNIERILRLALYSRRQLAELRAETGLHYDQLTRGILHIFRNRREFDAAISQLELMNRLGCRREVIDVEACVALEPTLADAAPQLLGGIVSPEDESGDAHKFCHGLAAFLGNRGVRFFYETRVRHLVSAKDRITAIETDHGPITADAVVIAGGSYSRRLVQPLGLELPIYPAKGYSLTIPLGEGAAAPVVALIDDEYKMVYARLGDRLRVAGTAEFTGYDTSVDSVRAHSLMDRAIALFPRLGKVSGASYWAGLRPSTPDGVPIIGGTRYSNLFLNTGHGTLGWTMACGSGRIVADLVQGRCPEVAINGLTLARFR